MKNQIKCKQICALFIGILPLIKFVTAPSYFASICKEKLWQPIVILFALDFFILLICLIAVKKHHNKSFGQILSDTYGNFFAKFIFFIYAVYFLLKGFIPLIEQKELIENAFYETLPQAPVFYPVFIIIFYLCLKGFKTFGRASGICLGISAIGLGLIILLSIPTLKLKNLLPLFAFTNKSAPICALNALSWFSDGIYLIFFLGYFEQKKGDFKRFAVSLIISFLTVLIFFVVFYSIFYTVSSTQKLALSSISIFGVTLVNVGRFDYIALFLLSVSSTMAISLPFALSTECLTFCFNFKNRIYPSIIVCVILLTACLLFSAKYQLSFDFSLKYFTPLFVICGYILPLLALGGKKREVQKI